MTRWAAGSSDSSTVRAEDYGALGDGTTDDQAAILAALSAGKAVRLSPGKTYKVRGKISVGHNRELFSEAGEQSAIISADTANWNGDDRVVELVGSNSGISRVNVVAGSLTTVDCVVFTSAAFSPTARDIKSSGGRHGFRNQCLETHLDHCLAQDSAASGVHNENYDLTCVDVSTNHCLDGYNSTSGFGSATLFHFHAINSSRHGFNLNGSWRDLLFGCHADTSGNDGFHILNTQSSSYVGCYAFQSSSAASGGTANVYAEYYLNTVSKCQFVGCSSGAAAYTLDDLRVLGVQTDVNWIGFHGRRGDINGSTAGMSFIGCTGTWAQYSTIDAVGAAARDFSRGSAARGAPVLCIARPTGGQTLSNANGAPSAISFPSEDVDTDTIHVNGGGNTQLAVPVGLGGVWRFRATLEFPANDTGSREVTVRKNGSTNVHTARQAAAGGTRATVVTCDTGPILADEGDVFDVIYYQDSGGSLTSGTTYTKFVAERVGDRIGPGGTILFDAAYKYKGLTQYPFTINPSKAVVVDDPVIGPTRQVIRVTTTNADNQVTYPRVQLQTPSALTSGDDVYVGLSVYVPADFADMTGLRSPVIHEFYGPPTAGYGPNVLRIRDNKFALEPTAIYNSTTGVATGAFLSWSLSLAGLKGKWVDFVHRVKLSTDPAVGLHQLWVDTGSGFTLQTLTDPATGASTGTTLELATLRSGVNDGGNNFSSLKLAYTDLSIGSVTLHYADHKLATNLADAQPHSY